MENEGFKIPVHLRTFEFVSFTVLSNCVKTIAKTKMISRIGG